MRKTTFMIAILAGLMVNAGFGQTPVVPFSDTARTNVDSGYAPAKVTNQSTDTVVQKSYKKNNVKINLSALLLKNYSVYYERMLTRKISASAGYRFMPETNLSEISHLKTFFKTLGTEDEDIDETLSKINMKNNAITAEVRFYLGHKPGANGFYFSLMGRYASFEFDYPYDYYANSKDYTIPLNGKFNTIGGGLGFGSQWIIGKRIVLDLYVLGGIYGKMNGDLNGKIDLSSLSPEQKLELEQHLEEEFTLGNNSYLNASVTNTGVTGKLSGPIIGLRAFGLSLGFAF